MAVRDAELIFYDNATTTTASKVIEFPEATDEFGDTHGQNVGMSDLAFLCLVGTTQLTVSGSPTYLSVVIETSEDGTTWREHQAFSNPMPPLSSPIAPGSKLANGRLAPDHDRFLRVSFDTDGTIASGRVNAHLSPSL